MRVLTLYSCIVWLWWYGCWWLDPSSSSSSSTTRTTTAFSFSSYTFTNIILQRTTTTKRNKNNNCNNGIHCNVLTTTTTAINSDSKNGEMMMMMLQEEEEKISTRRNNNNNNHQEKEKQNEKEQKRSTKDTIGAFIVDVENVRGKSGFRLSHDEFLLGIQLFMDGSCSSSSSTTRTDFKQEQQQKQSSTIPIRHKLKNIGDITLNYHDTVEDEDPLSLSSSSSSLYGKVTLVIDHGQVPSQFWYPSNGYSILFAGPNSYVKADDVIALDVVPYMLSFLQNQNQQNQIQQQNQNQIQQQQSGGSNTIKRRKTSSVIVVVTGDNQLIQRCLRAEKTFYQQQQQQQPYNTQQYARLHILSPTTFLQELEYLLEQYHASNNNNIWRESKTAEIEQQQLQSHSNTTSVVVQIPKSIITSPLTTTVSLPVDYSYKLGGELLEIETLLLMKNNNMMSTKRRQKLITKRKLVIDTLTSRRQQQQQDGNRTTKNKDASTNPVQLILDIIKEIRENKIRIEEGDHTLVLDSMLQRLTIAEKETLLSRYEKIENDSMMGTTSQSRNMKMKKNNKNNKKIICRKERTEDRIILAEELRQRILLDPVIIEEQQQQQQSNILPTTTTTTTVWSAPSFVYRKKLLLLQQQQQQTILVQPPILDKENIVVNSVPSLLVVNNETQVEIPNRFDVARTTDVESPYTIRHGNIRIVVISDTHGFEEQFTKLPPGDILLHLGDFAIDRLGRTTERISAQKFDKWLATQPHPRKIVVRGNHDPRSFVFTQSNALYITQAVVQNIGGYIFAFVPFGVGGSSGGGSSNRIKRSIIPTGSCDVVVSHVPPKQLLDQCSSGKNAGSRTLRQIVEKMKYPNGPFLWLCGHIHESRGIIHDHIFHQNTNQNNKNNKNQHNQQKENHIPKQTGTMIINAANANPGIARSLEYGPTVLHLGGGTDGVDNNNNNNADASMGEYEMNHHQDNSRTNGMDPEDVFQMGEDEETKKRKNTHKVKIIQMDGSYEFMNQHHPSFFNNNNINNNNNRNDNNNHHHHPKVLLAVDLGLRTGLCLFSDSGHILHYDNYQFTSEKEMKSGIIQFVQEWNKKLLNSVGNEKNMEPPPPPPLQQQQLQQQQQQWTDSSSSSITHVTIEGHDHKLKEIWKEIIIELRIEHLLFVQPEEWRNDLLIRVERKNGESCKAASRIIAQQIVMDYQQIPPPHGTDRKKDEREQEQEQKQSNQLLQLLSVSPSTPSPQDHHLENNHDDKNSQFQTDMAEAILLGFHVTRRLGWVPLRYPAIRRQPNGNVQLLPLSLVP